MHDDNGQDDPSNLWSRPPNRWKEPAKIIGLMILIFLLIEIAVYLATH